jgi:hypothetical protein
LGKVSAEEPRYQTESPMAHTFTIPLRNEGLETREELSTNRNG